MTDQKRVRNRIYRICGYGILVMEAAMGLAYFLGARGYIIMIIEVIMLHLFGFAWLVKGYAFPFLNDKEDDAGNSDSEVITASSGVR